MKKRIVAVILCIVMTVVMLPVMALAEMEGVVLPNYVSVRELPDESSKRLYKAYSSKELVIVGQVNEWYIVDLKSSGFTEEDGIGYVKSIYIVTTGYSLRLTGDSIYVYQDPWSGKANGERGNGDTLFVTYETLEWLVVKTNSDSSGSSFVRKSDVGLYNYVGDTTYVDSHTTGYIGISDAISNRWMVGDGYKVGIREQTNMQGEILEVIYSGDIVTVLQNEGEYAYVVYTNLKGQSVYGWVRTKYFVPAP